MADIGDRRLTGDIQNPKIKKYWDDRAAKVCTFPGCEERTEKAKCEYHRDQDNASKQRARDELKAFQASQKYKRKF